MEYPIVSILTTVYNREKYIAQCIESVLASTFQDWEMIIVDDCSKDNSVAIAREYEIKDPRVKVYVNEQNLGDYPNRNKAASYATGKYLKYLDADDMIYPHGLQIMVQTMEAHPEAALGISQEVAEDYDPFPFVLQPQQIYQREFLKRGLLWLGPTGTIIRKDTFLELGMFSGKRYIGDYEMWLKFGSKHPIVKMFPGLTFWRRHEEQEYNLGQKSFFYLEHNYILRKRVLLDTEIPLTGQERKMALKKINKRFCKDLVRLFILERKPLLAFNIARRSELTLINFIRNIF